MRYWALCFLVIFLSVLFVPLIAEKSVAGENLPEIEVNLDGNIEKITIEEYVLRVLIAENSFCENAETKKALAVSARSCASYFSLYGCKHENFAACDDGDCCIELGSPEDVDENTLSELISVCEATNGEILTLDSMPAIALFSKCASKGTRFCENFPYLTPVGEDAPCEIHKTEVELQIDDGLASLLGDTNEHPPYLVYDENEKCVLAILGGNIIEGEELASRLTLPTTEFSLTIEETKLKTVCYGIGHGYGLNLCYADKYAKDGSDYQAILKRYFPELEIKKIL